MNRRIIKNKQRKLLEELIKETVNEVLLTEMEDYSQTALYKTFIEPFTDVINTARHGAEKVIRRTVSTAGTLAKQGALLLIPFISPRFIAQIGKQDRANLKNRLAQVDAKYKDVLERNWSTLNELDVWGTLFLVNPGLAIGEKLVAKAPEVALDLLSTILGDSQIMNATKKWYHDLRTGGEYGKADVFKPGTHPFDIYGAGGDFGGWDAGAFEEQVQPTQQLLGQQQNVSPQQALVTQLQKILRNPQIRQQIASSKFTQTTQQTAINSILTNAKATLSNLTLPTIKQKAGAHYAETLKKLAASQKPKQGEQPKPPEELEKDPEFQKNLIAELKAALRTPFVKQLEALSKTNPAMSQMVNKAIQDVNRM